VIDDADTFGPPVAELAEDVATAMPGSLLIVGMRSARADRVMRGWRADGQLRREITVPLLEDSDISRLLTTLERHNQLGALKQLDGAARSDRIRRECGRELLVAMIEATSGERFETKAYQEFLDLADEQRLIYAIVALASEMRFALGRDEVLMATGDISNTALHALERLVANRLLIARSGGYMVRHRTVAELVVRGMRGDAIALAPYQGLVRAIAARHQAGRPGSREAKLITALISHARVLRFFALDDAQALYHSAEDLLASDYHFWLQRGSLEVESGNLSRAANYLQQAFAGGEQRSQASDRVGVLPVEERASEPEGHRRGPQGGGRPADPVGPDQSAWRGGLVPLARVRQPDARMAPSRAATGSGTSAATRSREEPC
jgi:hypothetical protein